ncbi:molecular chaperone [Acinetobacter sp. P8-3-8]|uniref:fimbrial biogenesis chaperone n=1 Tax=Acinetobacter sp. P8-3-8 TaxID=1029823 RepID=UPI0002486509|nr:fimbria/pilus periplasmic chaperone [Acinetobacter sp. P8-3-8]
MNKLFNVLVLGTVLLSPNIYAGLKISPIQLYISEKTRQRSATITLESSGLKEAKIFEMSAVKWTQNDKSEDVFEPDPTILINPKNFVIQPESKQIVRVGFTQPLAAIVGPQEKTWRIIFSEVPAVAKETSVSFLFNISVPLFLGNQDKDKLDIKTAYNQDNLVMNVKNDSSSHLQIFKIRIIDANQKEVAISNEMKYLLHGQQYTFNFGNVKLSNSTQYTLKIDTDKDEKPLEMKL